MCSPDAPDMTAQNAIAASQAKLSQEQMDWAKQIYSETAPDRAAATQRANAVSDAQLESMNTQTAQAKDYAEYQKGTFRPLEQKIVGDAQTYDTPERREAAAAQAGADVQMGLASARASGARNLERAGVQPGSGKAAALDSQMSLGAASATAAAANKARTQIETVGSAKLADAANLGRGLASNQATSAGLALTAGNNASANGQASGNINAQGNQIMNSGYAGAQSGFAGAAQTYGNITNQQLKANESSGAAMGALGKVAGSFAGSSAGSSLISTGLMAFSDENMKTDRKAVSPKLSLAAVRKMPVDSWRYKKGSAGDDGGKSHVGPMAQDVQRGLGDFTAPDGKKIDLISMNGHLTNAIKQLDKEVMSLKHARRRA